MLIRPLTLSQYTPRPYTQPSLQQLRASLRSIGDKIAVEGTPKKLGPFVIGLTGYVNLTSYLRLGFIVASFPP